MNIDVIFTPEMAPYAELSGKTVLVVDILRASSTITMALAHGAQCVLPVLTPEAAFARNRESSSLLCGERHGRKVPGFHLGNSPREYCPDIVCGKQLIFTTTNGTRALHACADAAELLVGSFLNARAVCGYLAQDKRDLVIVCSGKQGQIGIEDVVFAGLCVEILRPQVKLTDAAQVARVLYEHYRADILGMLKNCEHGQYLASIGLDADLEFCAQSDITGVIPISRDGRIERKR